jgi:hypothetical protein
MNRFCIGLLLVVAMILTAGSSTAHAAKGAKKKGEHHHRGTIVAVEENAGHGHITIKAHHHHKKGAVVGGSKLEKFQVNTTTQFELVHRSEHHAATIAAVHVGEHVLILAHEQHADKVEIAHHPHHKLKKGKK